MNQEYGSAGASVGKNGSDKRSGSLNEEQLQILRNALDGSVLDASNGFRFEHVKTFVEFASRVSPKFFGYFVESLNQGARHHAGNG